MVNAHKIHNLPSNHQAKAEAMQGSIVSAAIALSLTAAHTASAQGGIVPPDRVETRFYSPLMTSPIPATPECAEQVIQDYFGEEHITIVHKTDPERVSGFLDAENLREDITAEFADGSIVDLSLNVTERGDGYVFPYSLLASVGYDGSGRIATTYYPESELPNPANLLAEIDHKLRLQCS